MDTSPNKEQEILLGETKKFILNSIKSFLRDSDIFRDNLENLGQALTEHVNNNKMITKNINLLISDIPTQPITIKALSKNKHLEKTEQAMYIEYTLNIKIESLNLEYETEHMSGPYKHEKTRYPQDYK